MFGDYHLLRKRRAAFASTVSGGGVSWEILDEFTTDLAAGSVDGTNAEPGPGVRDVTDTTSKLSITGGKLQILSGNPAWGNPGLWYGQVARVAGLMFFADVDPAGGNYLHGFSASAASLPTLGALNARNSDVSVYSSGPFALIHSPISGQVQVMIASRSEGYMAFVKISNQWLLKFVSKHSASVNFYLAHSTNNTAVDIFRTGVPEDRWLPTPIASDGFGSSFGTTDGLGHREGQQSEVGSGGDGVLWTQNLGTWSVSSGEATPDTLSGGEAIATVETNETDVVLVVEPVRSAGEVGVAGWVDSDNYVLAYHDGSNIVVKEVVATVENTLSTTAFAYSAGAHLSLAVDSGGYRVFYNNDDLGTGTFSISPTEWGIYSSDTSNSLDDFYVYAMGKSNEYSNLIAYM